MTRWDADGAFGLAGGCVTVIGAAFVAALLFPPAETAGRLVVMSLAVAGVTRVTRDRRASAFVSGLAVLIFVGFLVHRAGVLTGAPSGWAEAAVLPVAALAGRIRPPSRERRASLVAAARRWAGSPAADSFNWRATHR